MILNLQAWYLVQLTQEEDGCWKTSTDSKWHSDPEQLSVVKVWGLVSDGWMDGGWHVCKVCKKIMREEVTMWLLTKTKAPALLLIITIWTSLTLPPVTPLSLFYPLMPLLCYLATVSTATKLPQLTPCFINKSPESLRSLVSTFLKPGDEVSE